MFLRSIPFICCLLLSFFGLAQMPDTFGRLSESEKKMERYEKDPEAHAVVLYERGDNYFKVIDNRILLVKEFHKKIKIIDEKAFKEGTIKIYLYHKGASTEKLANIKAVTHNGANQYNVLSQEIFNKDETERWRSKTFTFPKMEKGSILEYKYTITTPFDFNFEGWRFQSNIPKIYSEFNASIPGNYVYNRALKGSLALSTNDAKIKKDCFYVPGYPEGADCEVLKYTMKDIPAFQMEEDYSLSEENYISQIEFELSEYRHLDGTTSRYTKSWKDVDKEFRSDKDIGRQLLKKGFFERNVPEKLLTEGDPMTRAKNIYKFVQNHFNWNERYASYGTARVKDAFDAKKGNAWEINMSLINLLNAADIKTDLMMISTRNNGLPKQKHPVMNDFNYVLAKTTIDGQDFLLDATDKFYPFGYLPYRTLNHYGRVMDFKNESYWQDIVPMVKNKFQVRASIKFDSEAEKAIGVMDVLTDGYNAISQRKRLKRLTKEAYLDEMQEDGEEDTFVITDYKKNDERSTDERVMERFSFELEDVAQGDKLYFNPFLIHFFEENPFKLDNRSYPIDFGYPQKFRYQINIEVPEGYKIKELPENKAMSLDEAKSVTYRFSCDHKQRNVLLSFDLALNGTYFDPAFYDLLKALFKQALNDQKNTFIIFEKV